MSSTKNPGRVAGLYYLLLIAMGPLFLIYIPDKLYVKGNAAATVSNIAAHERLFRFGILAELVGGVILIFLVLAFYRLFQGVDPHLAVLVIILGGIMPAVMLSFAKSQIRLNKQCGEACNIVTRTKFRVVRSFGERQAV